MQYLPMSSHPRTVAVMAASSFMFMTSPSGLPARSRMDGCWKIVQQGVAAGRYGEAVELRVLGPVDVVGSDGGRVPLGGAKQRVLLAVLAVHVNEVVSGTRSSTRCGATHRPG